ncbi:MAG: 50S ribosome-binding GTPase [Candidatus Lokiarchaeota archaeon]|nr:50S ribosome-binding GTPase [Candidatus Lokiarchaeota archaeon]
MKYKPSLLIIGNSNVGKSSITRLLLPNPKKFKGKAGKQPGSTLLIKSIDFPQLPYKIVDLPGFGYMKDLSRRREEHIKKQLVVHVEKHHDEYFFGLLILNSLRIEDELTKYFMENDTAIPLTFELIKFLKEFEIPLLVILNKIDKISVFDKKRIISLLVNSSKAYGLNLIQITDEEVKDYSRIPYLEFSATKKTNLDKLKRIINERLQFKRN